jgi:hypothetical protein
VRRVWHGVRNVAYTPELTALELDALWLHEKGYTLNLEEFSFWVAREMEYGDPVEKAREAVAKMMRSQHE